MSTCSDLIQAFAAEWKRKQEFRRTDLEDLYDTGRSSSPSLSALLGLLPLLCFNFSKGSCSPTCAVLCPKKGPLILYMMAKSATSVQLPRIDVKSSLRVLWAYVSVFGSKSDVLSFWQWPRPPWTTLLFAFYPSTFKKECRRGPQE